MDTKWKHSKRVICGNYVDFLPKKKVWCKWIYTIKYKLDGSLKRHKVRLVAKDYTQTCEIDYSETFTHVAKIDTIRVLLSICTNKDWPLHQFMSRMRYFTEI